MHILRYVSNIRDWFEMDNEVYMANKVELHGIDG